jgi:hypothetical protein
VSPRALVPVAPNTIVESASTVAAVICCEPPMTKASLPPVPNDESSAPVDRPAGESETNGGAVSDDYDGTACPQAAGTSTGTLPSRHRATRKAELKARDCGRDASS